MREELLLAVLELTVGLGICLGCFAVYVPQHVACWRHRTAIGLSLGTILLGTLSHVALLLTHVVADSVKIMADYYHIHHHHHSQEDNDRTLQILNMLNAAMPSLQLVSSLNG